MCTSLNSSGKNLVEKISKVTEVFTEDTKKVIREKVALINIRRISFILIFAIPVHLAHVVIFLLNIAEASGTAYAWRLGIICIHSIMLLLASIIGAAAYHILKKKKTSTLLSYFVQVISCLAYLFCGVAIVFIDQLVTTSIIPLIITCSLVAMVILMHPYFAAICYLATYFLFYYSIGFIQHNPEVLLSNRVNGISATGIGLGIAVIMWRDTVTNLKYQEELTNNAKLLENHNKVKDRLFTIVSHDIRDPLAVLINLSELLEDEKSNLSPESCEIIDQVKSRVRDSYDMVEGLLDWFKNQMEGIKLQPKAWNLLENIQASLTIQEIKSRTKNITLLVNIDKNITVFVDRNVIELVFRNIISNAIKYTENGQIYIQAMLASGKVTVSVSDTGIGIHPKILPKLFNEIHIGSLNRSKGTRDEKGIGLGLLMCKEFLNESNGEIWLDSKPGMGTTVYFSLPSEKTDENKIEIS